MRAPYGHAAHPRPAFELSEPSEFGDMQRKQLRSISAWYADWRRRRKIVVMEPFLDSPAWKADLRRGDAIANVDGHDTTGLDRPRWPIC